MSDIQEQIDGILESHSLILNVVTPAAQSIATVAAVLAMSRGSLVLFWIFVVFAFGSLLVTYGLIKTESNRIEGLPEKEFKQGLRVSSRYVKNRNKGRIAVPIIAWIAALLLWVVLPS